MIPMVFLYSADAKRIVRLLFMSVEFLLFLPEHDYAPRALAAACAASVGGVLVIALAMRSGGWCRSMKTWQSHKQCPLPSCPRTHSCYVARACCSQATPLALKTPEDLPSQICTVPCCPAPLSHLASKEKQTYLFLWHPPIMPYLLNFQEGGHIGRRCRE